MGENNFPANFDCLGLPFQSPFLNGPTPLESIHVSTGTNITELGYSGGVSATPIQQAGITYPQYAWSSFGINPSDSGTIGHTTVTLDQTVIPFDRVGSMGSGAGYSYERGYIGELRVVSSNPPRIELDISMKCNINNAGFVTGGQARFVGQLNP